MGIEFLVKESAKNDIVEIVDWYDQKQAGLGERFYKELIKEFDKIEQNPKLYTFYNNNFRRSSLKHFPYLIIFKFTESEIIIYAVYLWRPKPKVD